MTTRLLPVASLSQVNQIDNGFSQNNPSAAYLQGGNWIVSWNNAAFSNIEAQLFGFAFNTAGQEFALTGPRAQNASLAGLTSGGLAAVYQSGGTTSVNRYNIDNQAVSYAATENITASRSTDDLSISGLPGNGYVVAYEGLGVSGTDRGGIYAAIWNGFTINTITVASNTFFETGFSFQRQWTATNRTDPSMSAAANGTFVVAYQSQSDGNTVRPPDQLGYSIFTSNGEGLNSGLLSSSFGEREQYEVDTAALSNDRFVFTWTDTDRGQTDIHAAVVDSRGTVIRGDFLVNEYVTGNQTNSTVAALDDGGFFVSWFDNARNMIVGETYDANGSAVGSNVLIANAVSVDSMDLINIGGRRLALAYDRIAAGDTDIAGAIIGPRSTTSVNGDTNTDIIWHNTGGQTALWAMSGNEILFGNNFISSNGTTVAPGSDWSVAGTGDFNSDSTTDVLWRNVDGSIDIWTMGGGPLANQIVASNHVTVGNTPVRLGPEWQVADTADFTGDGASEILWRNSNTGRLDVWTMFGSQLVGSNPITASNTVVAPGSDWSIAAATDLTGDGRADILWRNASGALDLWTMNGAQLVVSANVTAGGSIVAPGPDWSIAAVNDFTGNGHADLLWRNTNGQVDLWTMNGAQLVRSDHVTAGGLSVAPGSDWHVAGSGDFNGDGYADVLWQNDNGSVDIWNMNGAQLTASNHVTQQGFGAVSLDASWMVVG